VTTPVGLAIVGAGRMGVTHAEALRDEPSVRVNAVVDPSEAARANALRAAPGARAFAGLDDALAGGGVDAVLIAAPSPLHLPLVQACAAHGLPILARITGYATGATNPEDLFFAPIFAVRNLMQKTGSKIGDYDLIEANEAFASQALADGQELGWDWNRVNVNGGAIALGHPIGASGARVLTTLLYAMQDRGARTGLATLCLGGGDAVALSVERVD